MKSYDIWDFERARVEGMEFSSAAKGGTVTVPKEVVVTDTIMFVPPSFDNPNS